MTDKMKINTIKLLKHFSFSNIRTSFCSVESFPLKSSPDILAPCETNLIYSIATNEYSVLDYLSVRQIIIGYICMVLVFISGKIIQYLLSPQELLFHVLSSLHFVSYFFFLYRSSRDCNII